MTTFEILSLLIGTASAVLVVGHLFLIHQSLRADHERRRKQSTSEVMLAIRPHWHKGRDMLDDRWGREKTLSQAELEEIENDNEAHNLVRTLLAHLEHVAVCVNAEVYDEDLMYHSSGSFLVFMYDRLRPYIEKKQLERPSLFFEFKELTNRFRSRLHQDEKKWGMSEGISTMSYSSRK